MNGRKDEERKRRRRIERKLEERSKEGERK